MKVRSPLAVSAGIVALLASITLAALSIQPMKGDYYDCGTIFASADTWWYDATRSPERESAEPGSDIATREACEGRHERRLITMVLVGALVLASVGTIGAVRRRSRIEGSAR